MMMGDMFLIFSQIEEFHSSYESSLKETVLINELFIVKKRDFFEILSI